MAEQDVLVVGAGVVGASIAYYLSRTGLRVELIEAGGSISATAGASLGILTHFNGGDNPYSKLYQDGHACYETLAAELADATGIDIGWRALGGIDLVFNDTDVAAARALLEYNRGRGCTAEWLDQKALRQIEPHIAQAAEAGVFFPDDHRVDPPCLTKALLTAAAQNGVRIAYNEPLEELVSCGSGMQVRTAKGIRSVDFVVLAAGSWTRALGQQWDAEIPVRPIRGQHRRFAGKGRLRHILRYEGHYLTPAWEQIIVGATVEEVGFVLENTAAVNPFNDFFERLLDFSAEPLGERVGLRPKPKGGRPLIGPLKAYPQVFIATGHYKNGVLLGPITGQIISAWLTQGAAPRDMDYFVPER